MTVSFATLEIEKRFKADSVLSKLKVLVDWEGLRPYLKGLYRREFTQGGGQEPFDVLKMFKSVLLGQWHSLSDAKLEEALRVRLDFIDFCEWDLGQAVPDETTLCRFRNRLVETNRLSKLLEQVNRCLGHHGLMMQEAQGAVIDASLITSAARPRKELVIQEGEVSKEGEEVGLSDFRLHRIKPSDKIINVLPKLPANSIVLALPDTELYNPYTLLTIIEDIYKHQQILIGFAPGFVKYGALAAPYSDNADIAAQAGEVLRGMQRSLATPKTQYPKYFRIVVNENVAKIRGANIQITESRPPRR